MVEVDSPIIGQSIVTRNDLPGYLRATMITILNQQLADTSDLYSQVKQAHWNVRGTNFIQYHDVFDELAANLLGYVDTIAERVRALGGDAAGTARMVAGHSHLPEFPADIVGGKQVIEVLAQRYGAYGSEVRAIINKAAEFGDPVTADLFTEVSRIIDIHLWMLDAHLQA